jgi:DNA-binding transcriptional regulator YiaG
VFPAFVQLQRAEPATILFNNLPHPGLLPKEKEKRPPPLLKNPRLDLPDTHPQNHNRATAIPSPRGRTALLGFAQRQIRVSRAHITLNRQRRKPIPSVIKSIGDYIQAKRYKKGLHPYQVARKMRISASLISAWERGASSPNEEQWQMLSNLLSFDSGVDFPKPHRGRLLGFTQ